METLQIIFMKYLLGFGLQSFALVLGIYTFNKKKLILKDCMLVSIFVAIVSWIVKLLPITIGAGTIINTLFIYIICAILLKMPAYTTIRSTVFCIVLILFSEMVVTTVAIIIMGKKQFEVLIADSIQRIYIGVLANIVFALVVTFLYYRLRKKGDGYGKTSAQNS